MSDVKPELLVKIGEKITSLYFGDDWELEQLIIQVIARLPQDVQEFVFER